MSFVKKRAASFLSRYFSIEELFKPAQTKVLTPLVNAVEELKRRQSDEVLRKKVENYLHGDIPSHFKDGPILYLARHLATPNFETLRFLHLVEPLELPTIIGQDLKDKFVPNNELKRALGKPSVSNGISKKNEQFHEQFVNVCVVDFNKANGKQLKDIETLWGENLADFHARLFTEICKRPATLVDDSEWIDRQHRGNILEHYKKFLALFLVHGILFEDLEYEDEEEKRFMNTILLPAFKFIEHKFGYRPLIAQLTPTSVESPRFWLSYPKEAKDFMRHPNEQGSV